MVLVSEICSQLNSNNLTGITGYCTQVDLFISKSYSMHNISNLEGPKYMAEGYWLATHDLQETAIQWAGISLPNF